MTTFGGLPLTHVLDIQTTKSRIMIDRDLPYGSVAYRADDRDLGQSFILTGEIRETTIDAVYTQIERIRRLNDGAARSLDLEDGNTTITSKLTDPSFNFAAENWFTGKYHVPYQVTFLEVA